MTLPEASTTVTVTRTGTPATASVGTETTKVVPVLLVTPPPGDGQWSWWDSACCYEDVIAPARGDRKIYSSSKSGKCPDPAHYRTGDYHDNCLYNVVWSLHAEGGNFCMGDGSVRSITFEAGNSPIGTTTLLEALSTRRGAEILPQDE